MAEYPRDPQPAEIASVSQAIKDAIASGAVTASIDEARVDKGKYRGEYLRLAAKSLKGAAALCNGDEASMLKFFNYGFVLDALQATRRRIEASNVDPEKGIERAAKVLISMPKSRFKTLAEAVAHVRSLTVAE